VTYRNATDMVLSSPTTLSVIAAIIILVLIIDGIITSLPFYNLRSQRSDPIVHYFGIEVIVCGISQLILLRIVMIEIKRSSYTARFLKSANITQYIVLGLQCVTIGLLFIIFLELVFFDEYNTLYLRIVILTSISLSIGLLSILTIRFVQWTRHRPDPLVISYTVAVAMMASTSLFLGLFMLVEMAGVPDSINSSRMSITNSHVSNFEIQNFQATVGLISYIAFWFASVLLLRNTIGGQRKISFYLLVTIPLLYYLGIFQWIFSFILVNSDILSALQMYTFNIIGSILVRPIGGAILGAAFLIVSRKVQDPGVKNYMKFSALGIMLLAISNEDARIYLLPYPPFGLVTISFIGISSYLLMVGIYYSSVSTSMNSQIRSMIERSVDKELSFLSNIGRSQMEKQILNRVKTLTERFADDLKEDSGVSVGLKTEDIVQQISLIMKEKEAMSHRKNNHLKDK
jgi:hypothetical protein